MKALMDYLIERYAPRAILVYGSFADGTQGPDSDFDALLIVDEGPQRHDTGIVDGVRLDVFIYPVGDLGPDCDPETYAQVFDAVVALDLDGDGARLKRAAASAVAARPRKSPEALSEALCWCDKMVARAGRGDAEGYFRWHWLLTDSLEIAMDLLGLPWLGPKKSLRELRKRAPEACDACERALSSMDPQALRDWIGCLRRLSPSEA